MTFLRAAFEQKSTADALVPYERDIIYSDPLPSMANALRLAVDYTATYEEIVRRQLWARIAVNKISYAIGRLPLKAFSDAGDERQYLTEGDLPALMHAPNDTKDTGITPGFLARIAYDLLVYGNAIIVKVQRRPNLAPVQLRPMCPRGWYLDDGGKYAYRNAITQKEETFEPWRIIHIIEPGPTAGGFGTSRLEAARLTLAIEYAAQRLGVATFNNGARPGGVLNVKDLKAGQGETKAAVIQRFKQEIVSRFGGVDKAGLPAVLEGDVSWLAMSHNLDDSAVVAHRQLTREEIAALYDIPQPAIGILDEANFASVDALHVFFYQDSLGWPIKLIESALNAQLVRGVDAYAGQFLEFDLNAVMRGDPASRAAFFTAAVGGPWMTVDEARRLENMASISGTQPQAGMVNMPLNMSPGLGVAQEAP